MYTRCQKTVICLHGSIDHTATQHEWSDRFFKSQKKPPETGGFSKLMARLFGCLLAGRVQCAGIVDFGDLMVAESKHLAQDLVGVFAKQW